MNRWRINKCNLGKDVPLLQFTLLVLVILMVIMLSKEYHYNSTGENFNI
jgi:hypothetical protein